MSQLRERAAAGRVDWDAVYRQGTPPWDTGTPAAELVRLVEAKTLRPARTLELGCGSGADAIYLAQRGFEMTAVDSSPIAVERARVRAEREDALLRLVLADAFEFGQTAGQFELVFDVGLYHFIRHWDLERFLDLLWRVTQPGSYYFTVAAPPRALWRRPAAGHAGTDPARAGPAVRGGAVAGVPAGELAREGGLSRLVVSDATAGGGQVRGALTRGVGRGLSQFSSDENGTVPF